MRILIIEDELIDLASAFNSMCDGLEISFNKLKQLSSDLAHELRTPINNLIGETELALSQTRNVEAYQKILISNLEESRRISQMVSGLLFLAKTENSQLIIEKKYFSADKLINSVCDFYSALAEEKLIRINCSGEGEVLADEVLFRRVINNLLSNAIKYTPENGEVKINISSSHKKKTVITLSDTGVGIAELDLPFIFNRFYRSDKARSQSSGGLGLGLAIVKSIIELHGASIKITAELGKGTVAELVFPSF